MVINYGILSNKELDEYYFMEISDYLSISILNGKLSKIFLYEANNIDKVFPIVANEANKAHTEKWISHRISADKSTGFKVNFSYNTIHRVLQMMENTQVDIH